MNIFESFKVEGIHPSDIWQLPNCSNYQYYKMKVNQLLHGVCGFCHIDLKINTIYFEGDYWIVMENSIAPRSDKSGQEHQFVIPCKRHIQRFNEVTTPEALELLAIIKKIDRDFNITGGVLVIRSGDPAKNARSMPHLHVNYHVPTGLKRVEITIAKSQEDVEKKLEILKVFEKMRINEEVEGKVPTYGLTFTEMELVKDKVDPKGSC